MSVVASLRPGRPAGATPPALGALGGVRPFLKWAGGKRQLLPALRSFYPPQFGAYFEPFVGSGAVFFDLAATGRLDGHPAVLSDVNHDVIGCYQALRREPAAVIRALRALEAGHSEAGVAHYYAVRDGRFNPRRLRLLSMVSEKDAEVRYPASVAAMLIYLNRTGFNGLFRLNRLGRFNVPAGRYERPRICDAANLRAVARALEAVDLRHASYERTLDRARPGDFIYFDPPYAPVSATARFTAYTADGFGEDDQARLQQVVVKLASRGCQVLLSNSVSPVTSALYEHDASARGAGLRAWRVPARRAINADARRRGAVDEFLVTNIAPREARTDDRLPGPLGVN